MKILSLEEVMKRQEIEEGFKFYRAIISFWEDVPYQELPPLTDFAKATSVMFSKSKTKLVVFRDHLRLFELKPEPKKQAMPLMRRCREIWSRYLIEGEAVIGAALVKDVEKDRSGEKIAVRFQEVPEADWRIFTEGNQIPEALFYRRFNAGLMRDRETGFARAIPNPASFALGAYTGVYLLKPLILVERLIPVYEVGRDLEEYVRWASNCRKAKRAYAYGFEQDLLPALPIARPARTDTSYGALMALVGGIHELCQRTRCTQGDIYRIYALLERWLKHAALSESQDECAKIIFRTLQDHYRACWADMYGRS